MASGSGNNCKQRGGGGLGDNYKQPMKLHALKTFGAKNLKQNTKSGRHKSYVTRL